MSIYNIPPLLAAIANLFLGGLVIGKRPKGRVNRAWGLLTLFIAVWSFGTFTLYISHDTTTALSWLKLYNLGVILIPPAFMHFAFAISDDESSKGKTAVVSAYLISGIFVGLSLLGLFNPSVSHHTWGYYPVTGPANFPFDLFFAIAVCISGARLLIAFNASRGWKRNQFFYIFIATVIGFGSGATNFLPLYGGKVYPMGHVGILVTGTIITIAIIRYRFMDITLIIRNSAVYSVLTAIVTAAYVSIVFVLQAAFRGLTGNNSTLAVIIVALIVAMTFEPVRRNVQVVIDKLFFREKFEFQQITKETSETLRTEVSPENIASHVLRVIVDAVQTANGLLMILDRESNDLLVVASSNVPLEIRATLKISRDSRPIEHMAHTRRPLWLDDPDAGVFRRRVDNDLRDEIDKLGVRSLFPLYGKKELVGVMLLGEKRSGDVINHNDSELIMTICNQAAISIENSRLYDDLQASYLNTVKSLVAALEAKDEYTKGHSERVASYARAIAFEMKLSDKDAKLLYEVSLLHDVGKIGVSERVLNKKGKLTREELIHVQSHTITGEKILSTVGSIRDGLSAVRHHHEKLNGEGYPDGLSEVTIPLNARILAVADSYDAMTTKRPYREAMTENQAVQELKDYSGKQFDPRVVRAFISVLLKTKNRAHRDWQKDAGPKRPTHLRTA